MKYDHAIPLKMRVEDKCIQARWYSKWRNLRWYPYNKVPSDNIVRQALQTFRLNAGLDKDQEINPVWETI